MKRLRFAIALFALVAGVTAYFSAAPDTNAVVGPVACTYYSNSTYKKAVGGYADGCCGGRTYWGQQTVYVKCQTLLCPDVVCPD
ncbi:MAG TPA: DUF6289 family protein [Candidatus Polarisedimenticolaceae bacterium]|nr:DUF6289 family protein [Candidatus Polarisedimenticolaceae bacterium]